MDAICPWVTTILPGSSLRVLGDETVGRENRRPQQEEMQQRLAEDLLHHWLVPAYFAGVYQIGEV